MMENDIDLLGKEDTPVASPLDLFSNFKNAPVQKKPEAFTFLNKNN